MPTNAYDQVSAWITHPFSEDMDLTGWVVFTLLIATIAYLWTFCLRELLEEQPI